jgi:hypothetical protein
MLTAGRGKTDQILTGHEAGKNSSLPIVTIQFYQEIMLLPGFHPVHDHLKIQGLSHGQDCLDNGYISRTRVSARLIVKPDIHPLLPDCFDLPTPGD